MSVPAISICIPAYQAEKYLRETLDSVRVQTFADWELIVTEDGSRDSTEQIVNDFARTVSQPVRYTRHDPNRGLPATRNAGISAARAAWIALLDSDDLWQPDHLASLLATAEKTSADLIHAGSTLFDSDSGRPLETRAPSPDHVSNFPLSLYRGEYIIQPASVLLRRSLWEKVGGFNPAFRYVEDREMWLRCARAEARFAYTGRETCLYRKHAAALSLHADRMALACAEVLQQHLDWEKIPRPLRVASTADAWLSAGRLQRASAPAAARRSFAHALRLRPFSLRIVIYWLTTFARR